MTEVLSGVLSTKVLGFCPRELLGKLCVASDYPCLCKDMKSSAIEVEQDSNGGATVVLSIELDWLAGNDWGNIRRNIELLGYRATYRTSAGGIDQGMTIVCSFDCSNRANQELREHAVELGI